MSIFKSRNFRRFWTGFATSQVGSQVTVLALPLAVLATGGSAFQVSLVAAATYIPVILVSPIAGVIADRSSPLTLARRMDLIRFVFLIFVVCLSLVWSLPAWAILTVAFSAGCLKAIGDVGNQALLPTIVSRSNVTTGNSFVSSATTISSVIGPAIAGALISVLGPIRSIVIDAVSFLYSWLMLRKVQELENPASPRTTPKTSNAPPSDKNPQPISNWVSAISEGVKLLSRDPLLLGLAVVAGGANIFAQCYATAILLYMAQQLNMSSLQIGAAFAFAAIGGILGAYASAKLAATIDPGIIMRWSMVIFGSGPLLTSLISPDWNQLSQFISLGLGMVLYEGGLVSYNVQGVTRRQTHAPREQLGRMTAAYRVITYGTPPLGSVLAGAIVVLTGSAQPALLVAGAGVMVWCAIIALTRFRIAFSKWDEARPTEGNCDAD